MTEINPTNGVTGQGQTFSTKGVKMSDLEKTNKALFDYFKGKGLSESSYVYSSDIEKLIEEFDKNDNGELSKKELKSMGLDLSRSERKSVNKALQKIMETELSSEGSYPVQVDENTTDFYNKDNVKTKSVVVRGNNTYTTELASDGQTVIKTINDEPGFGRITKDYSEPGAVTVTYEGDKLIAKNEGIVKEEMFSQNGKTILQCTYLDGKTILLEKDENDNWIEVTNNKTQSDETVDQQLTDVTEEPEVQDTPQFKEVFEKAGKKVTIDETGSTQRLTKDNTWNTDVVIPKRAAYDGNGVPKEIAIALPDAYGTKGPDGVAQRRYQNLKLVDPENNIYSDRSGVRHFQMNITDDGITLKQVNYENGKVADLTSKDSEKIKTFLDQNVKTIEEEVDKNYHKEHKSPFVRSDMNRDATQLIADLSDPAAAKAVVGRLSDRNSAWQTYLQIGTENGSLTGDNGLLEVLYSEGGYKTYDSIKPALDGLMSAIPDTTQIKNSQDYKNITNLINALENSNGNMSAKTVRRLDEALIRLAKNNMVNPQGTNYANNSFLRSANNNVIIEPDYENSMWRSDAKFTIGGENYYFYRNDLLYDKCYDFQDIVGNNKLITNDSTANNRKGEISFNAGMLDPQEEYYFQRKGGDRILVKVDSNGVGYVEDPNNMVPDKDDNMVPKRIPINDILNGRVPMPD